MEKLNKQDALTIKKTLALDWVAFNRALRAFSEHTLWAMLDAEKAGAKRKSWLIRLHRRACRLRTRREEMALLELAK